MAPIAIEGPPSTGLSITPVTKAKTATDQSLLRKATLKGIVRTRDQAGLDTDTDDSPFTPRPAKRARTVTFSPVLDVQPAPPTMDGPEPITAAELESVRVDVRIAIEAHVEDRSDEGYDRLKEVFAPEKGRRVDDTEASSTTTLKLHLIALRSCVNLLGKNCSGLIRALLNCDWVGRDEGFVKEYVQFLGHLASAQGAYVGIVVNTLVGNFRSIRSPLGRVPDCPVVSCEEMASRVHMALKYLLRLIPSASSTMVPILSARFPFVEDSKKAHMEYINNLIRLIEYAPELKSDVFALITERLVKIDARVQKDLDDIDEKLAADILQSSEDREVGDMEDDSDADSVSSEEEDDDDEDPDEMKVLQGNVEKMDAILDKLFQVYTPYFEDPNSGDAHRMFDTLLSHFRNIILPTYRSRHTQFLLFHFAQTSELLIDTFAGECVDLAFKSGRPAILKHSAAAYLASFVARGARVPAVVVRDVFDYIGTCIDAIREDNEQTCRGPDLQRYGTFYANTQALLYIFCFRWRDLVVSATGDEEFDDDDPAALLGRDLRWRTGVRELLSRTIYSKLNPLKICAQPIVQEFAKIALKLNFMMIYPLLESNKRVRLSQYTRGVGGGNNAIRETNFNPADGDVDSWHQLDAYFPFDPYQLPLSRRWVDDDYVEWKGLPGDMDEDEMDDTSDVEDEDLEYDDEDVQTATETDDEE